MKHGYEAPICKVEDLFSEDVITASYPVSSSTTSSQSGEINSDGYVDDFVWFSNLDVFASSQPNTSKTIA